MSKFPTHNSLTETQLSLQDILKFHDPSVALKQLQGILEGSPQAGTGLELQVTREYTTFNARLIPDSISSEMEMVPTSPNLSSSVVIPNYSTVRLNDDAHLDLMEATLEFEASFLRTSTAIDVRPKAKGVSLPFLELENGNFSNSLLDSVSPRFLQIQSPDENVAQKIVVDDEGHDDDEGDDDDEKAAKNQLSKNNFAGALPTPGISLVEQLKMDQPLMETITNKHKRGYYRCTHCPQTFSNIFEYASHMDEFEIKREFKCPFALCPWKILGLPRRPDLRRHCAIQHKHELPDDLKEFLNLNCETYPALKCPHQYCDKVFHRRDAYNRHIAIVHEKLGSRFNKRLFQILADCPYDKEIDRHKFVKTKMRSKKLNCNNRNAN